jgi:TatD DNase family protein
VIDLVDIGANLTHDSFSGDFAAVLKRAAAAGVRRLIVTGGDLASSRQAQRLAAGHKGCLYATAGTHPHHAAGYASDTTEELRGLLADPCVVAVGECGLDYFRDFSPRPAQRHAFEAQLALAQACAKPVFLHQRDAHADFLAMLREHAGGLRGGVAHCFTGSRAEMESYLELGLYIGITGWICDERRGQPLREAVPHLPLERVLLETDAPYLLPRDLRPQPAARRNEPAFLPHVLHATARWMNVGAEQLAQAATQNAERLFGLPPSDTDPQVR